MGRATRIEFLWVAAIIQFVMCTSATNTTSIAQVSEELSGAYAWSAWGSWSACSRSCGGGVAVQARECLPRSQGLVPNMTLPTPVITVRVTRRARSADCIGVAKRYHECNTAPCVGGVPDMRAEQCSAYDRRPFRGRFYTWVPYIDGDSPCTLNCRPLGKHFYASLSLVADGTPCTRPGFRAICVQGACKVVGRDAVLAGNNLHEIRCGRRLVSGMFSRPRLPLGYSYVTTVPRGACRLNVTEIMSSENYIALKITNGSYVMNGEFAVSAPGTYEAAGARFMYSRPAGLDAVFAHGPIQHPIDIMVLYTQPNPSIKYEYYTESPGGDIEIESITRSSNPDISSTFSPKHTRRHHSLDYPRTVNVPRFPNINGIPKETFNSEEEFEENVIGDRRFVWKILSYTQCSRSCGGGIQVGKYRCVETSVNGDRDVAPIHCSGSSPASRRRRCGNIPCPPRWRSAAWSQCPTCGPATRTRIVGCVQDHSRGITKISDQKCPMPKPSTNEPCDIPNCSDEDKQIETRRVKRPRDQNNIDSFHDGPVYSVAVNSSENEIGPEYNFNNAAAGWLFTEWSECVGWCVGGGVQTRSIRCADPSGCAPRKSPEELRTCTPKASCEPHEGHWFTGQWSPCSSPCNGRQIRGVLCIGGSGRHLRDTACKPPRPEQERACEDQCSPMWYYSEWGQCTGNCTSNVGIQRRTVWCARGAGGAGDDACAGVRNKPPAQRPCIPQCSATVPPEFIESQKIARSDTTTTTTTTTTEATTSTTTQQSGLKDCKDKLTNCALAVQARLCHYKYYTNNCCHSCRGR